METKKCTAKTMRCVRSVQNSKRGKESGKNWPNICQEFSVLHTSHFFGSRNVSFFAGIFTYTVPQLQSLLLGVEIQEDEKAEFLYMRSAWPPSPLPLQVVFSKMVGIGFDLSNRP